MRSTLYTGGTGPYPARHPENSGGEAATFPKALDITNKEESLWVARVGSVLYADGAQNGEFCAFVQA